MRSSKPLALRTKPRMRARRALDGDFLVLATFFSGTDCSACGIVLRLALLLLR